MAKRDITNYSNIFTKKEQNLFSGIWIKVTSSYKTIGLNKSICLVLTKKKLHYLLSRLAMPFYINQ